MSSLLDSGKSVQKDGGVSVPLRIRFPFLNAWPIVPALVLLGVFFAMPIGALLGVSFMDAQGRLSLENYARLWQGDVYFRVLWITLKTAGWVTLFTVLFAYPVAFLLATVRNSTRNSLIVWILMPLWTSFLVRTFAWMVLLGRHGVINQFLLAIGVVDMPVKMIYNFTGVLIGMMHAVLPLCIMTMLPTMESIDPNLTRAAGTLGARPGQSFWRIYFPLSMPGVASGGLITFITAIGFFVMPALLGGPNDTMIAQLIIFQINQMLNWGFAGAISLLFILSALVIFFIYEKMFGLSTLSGGARHADGVLARAGNRLGGCFVAGMAFLAEKIDLLGERIKPARPDAPIRNGSRRVLWAVVLIMIVFLCGPALFVIPVSFTSDNFINWPPSGFSLQWYEAVLGSRQWLAAAGRSGLIALLAAGCSMTLGVPVAFFIMRQRFKGKAVALAFVLSPMIVPHVIIAIALFYIFSRMNLVGTITGMVIGHSIINIPYVVITVMSLLKYYDVRLDQAASLLGATKLRTFRHVTLPILRSGLIAAAMFAFVMSFDELTVALFVTGGQFETLPKLMWDDALLNVNPSLTAAASLLLGFMTIVILVSNQLERRGRR
ncbi:ABC transporter permease subunit [Burkholderia sp. JKS000303]|uniref:ABC transporter permease subunit n=1 Tax=Burkholderia sp. JKS000303 TaxID=1938747 RepID=UPI000BF7E518|nr:ABC transporter permease subunit [Burkholderia sp. JKS000303]PFH28942.1 putative spermidine/putrescine transport system permease protein [Burkholderia sp. JKS000303]